MLTVKCCQTMLEALKVHFATQQTVHRVPAVEVTSTIAGTSAFASPLELVNMFFFTYICIIHLMLLSNKNQLSFIRRL